MDVNIFLFDKFETLDAFGPAEVFGNIESYNLCYYSLDGGIITSSQNVKVMTEKIGNADMFGILLIPGGQGTRLLVNDNNLILKIKEIAINSIYCLCVCTGSALLAKTNLLNNKNATSNKKSLKWVKSINSVVNWIDHARWVVDGKFYTSSGISAGIDMSLGFISDRFGEDKANFIASNLEYIWNDDKGNDIFAI